MTASDWLQAWEECRTGFPWIDAIMAQLHQWGWMHHLARHCVVCGWTHTLLSCTVKEQPVQRCLALILRRACPAISALTVHVCCTVASCMLDHSLW